jgi:hypothetical protein
MIQFMGRENMADYNADFLTMLETWDAAVQHLESLDSQPPQAIELATLLGWTQARTGGGEQMNRTGAKWMGCGEDQQEKGVRRNLAHIASKNG